MKKLIIVLILLTRFAICNAQKQPVIQEISLRAPDNIKIDGTLNEWENKLQAKNNIDRIKYTICNDDNKLYLTVQALGVFGDEKIVHGGITFTVSHSVEKRKREKAPNNVAITFPLVDKEKALSIDAKQYAYFNIDVKERPAHKKETDSLYEAINLLADDAFKEIKIIGIKGVDTLISVYNTDGIKAAARFDKTMCFVYELAIPLKYIGIAVNDSVKFSYNIKINAPTRQTSTNRSAQPSRPVFDTPSDGGIGGGGNTAPNPNMIYRLESSDFWAEYTLAKK